MTNPHDYSGTEIGSLLPFLLLPAGAFGGYFLRRWQEENPGQVLPGVQPGILKAPHIPGAAPKVSGPWYALEEPGYAVGGPWVDLEEPTYTIGQWMDIVGKGGGGSRSHARRHRHRQMMQGGGGGDCQDQDDDDPNAIEAWVGRGGGGSRGAHHAHHWHPMQMQGGGGGDCQDQDVGDPDDGYTIGGPWLDIVGADVSQQMVNAARSRSWPQTRGLIRSAINEVNEAASYGPAAAYVWSLDPPYGAPDPYGRVTLEGTTGVFPFRSVAEALDYMRQRIQTPHVALALFDRSSPHWPNPINWTKSNDPAYEPVIATQAAKGGARVAGWYDIIGADTRASSAIGDVRARAQTIANKRAGSVVGVIHTTRDGLWHALAFRNGDDADDWLGTATHDPSGYTYAAYYDKEDFQWPHPVNEKIGGPRGASRWGV